MRIKNAKQFRTHVRCIAKSSFRAKYAHNHPILFSVFFFSFLCHIIILLTSCCVLIRGTPYFQCIKQIDKLSRANNQLHFQQVPYAADIPGNFYAGRRLFVSGIVPKAAKQFSIDFHAGTELATRIRTIFPMKVRAILRSHRVKSFDSSLCRKFFALLERTIVGGRRRESATRTSPSSGSKLLIC